MRLDEFIKNLKIQHSFSALFWHMLFFFLSNILELSYDIFENYIYIYMRDMYYPAKTWITPRSNRRMGTGFSLSRFDLAQAEEKSNLKSLIIYHEQDRFPKFS